MSQAHNPLPPCHFCAQSALKLVPGYPALARVTSDCQPVQPGGELAVCMKCAAVQKPIHNDWKNLVHTIYSQYKIYHQSGGLEQVIFDQNTGSADSRSAALLRKLLAALPSPLPDTGRLLDVGCGNGALLAAFSHQLPGWRLTGTELSGEHRGRIEAIRGVEAFFAGPVADVPGPYDLITLIHVLEHVPEPAAFLIGLAGKLRGAKAGEGQKPVVANLVIEVPDHTRNPFDLLIADHSAHFTPATLGSVLRQAGFEAVLMRDDLVPKELSAGACLSGSPAASVEYVDAAEAAAAFERVSRRVAWLASVIALAERTAADGPLGVFGTSIAGTWLGATLGDRVSFYVDEDTARHGRRFMGRPVMGVKNAPAGVPVLLALPPWLATDVAKRLAGSGVEWLQPPMLEG